MISRPSAARLLFDGPARYQVRVLGWLNPNWSDRLEGMAINQDATDEERPICTLEGEILDQSALLGLLITLYELHLPVLLVKCLTCSATIAREP